MSSQKLPACALPHADEDEDLGPSACKSMPSRAYPNGHEVPKYHVKYEPCRISISGIVIMILGRRVVFGCLVRVGQKTRLSEPRGSKQLVMIEFRLLLYHIYFGFGELIPE